MRRATVLSLTCCLLILTIAVTEVLDVSGTIVSFTRRLDTCDTQDLPITDSEISLVYAFDASGEAPSSDTALHYHTDRGSLAANLLTPPVPEVPPADAVESDFTPTDLPVPFTADSPKTTYWCQIMSLNVTEKRQIISWEPVFSPPENIAYVHHILLYTCPLDVDYSQDVGKQDLCDKMIQVRKYMNCIQQLLIGWAVGAGKFSLPEDIGLPIGPSYPQYVLMQTHYNNQEQKNFTDSSGLRLTHTGKLRPTDAGIFWNGMLVDSAITIPARTKAFSLTTDCPPNATRAILPESGIKVHAVSNHMHQIGAAASLRHYRDGIELPPMLENPMYDFNYQSFTMLSNPRIILPGDNFATHCTWDSSLRSEATIQGGATTDEMCMSFMVYSPRIPDDACHAADYRKIHPEYGIIAVTNQPGRVWTNLPVPKLTQPYVEPKCEYWTPKELGENGEVEVKNTIPQIQPTSAFNPSSYARSLQLNEDNGGIPYMLYWNVNYTSSTIDMALSVDNQQGWIGVGISPTGGMIGSDVITAFATYTDCVASNPAAVQPALCPVGKQYLAPHGVDRLAKQHSLPPEDINQDFFNIVVYSDLPLIIPVDSSSSS